jgi:integrase
VGITPTENQHLSTAHINLDLADVDIEASTVAIVGKRFREKRSLTVPAATITILREWILIRGADPGPLCLALERAGRRGRLAGRTTVWGITQRLGLGHAHGLRYRAITTELAVTAGNVRDVSKFSRYSALDVPRWRVRRNDRGRHFLDLVRRQELDRSVGVVGGDLVIRGDADNMHFTRFFFQQMD